MKADEMAKDMRPSEQGILTTNDGKVAGVAHVMRKAGFDTIPNMTDGQLAELQFASFDLNHEQYMLKVAGAVRRHTEIHGERGQRPVMDLYFVNGPLTRMTFGRDIEVVYPNGTSEVVAPGAAGEQRRLESLASAPWMHIDQSGAGIVGLSGVADVQVASAPWTHTVR